MKRRKKQDDYFTQEIAPYYTKIYQYLIHLGCEENTAYDMAQETMKSAWENIDKLMDIDYAVYWIFHVAKNKYIDEQRLAFHKYELCSASINGSDRENSKVIKDITDFITKQESYAILDKALSQLDKQYSSLIRMKYFGGLTSREISEKLGINENTIRSTIMRGIHKLHDILNDLGYIKEDMYDE